MVDLGRSLREAFFMFWETLWPLVLGFGLSGAVQAFVPRERLQAVMGDHRAPAVARATGLGMVSSSCSYAATAMAKSLFQKGADFVTAMVFMFASTNLVIELGITLVVLMGWQFAAAEFVGGPIMIVLLAVTGGFVVRGGVVAAARRRLADNSSAEEPPSASSSVPSSPGPAGPARAGWADAAGYAISDLTMLRRELVIGYLVAGVLAVVVPVQAWNVVFLHGHGWLTTVENALVGPLVALLSFVCSVGNVPLAAALWKGGIAFGGVVSFIFADLITLPLVLVYRKYYGSRLALRLLLWFWAVMAAAGLLVEVLARAVDMIPAHSGRAIVPDRFEWNYTTVLNLIFLVVFAGMWWLHRRSGSGDGFATDPICGMQVRIADAPATATVDGHRDWFCSDGCRDRFVAQTR